MQTDEQIDHLRQQSLDRPLTRRDFVRALGLATAAGPGLVTAALSGFALTSSQRAEALSAVVDGIGKLPKVDLGKRLGNMKVTRVCIASDWNQELFAPALELGINFVHKAGYWNQLPDAFKNVPRESYYTDITVDSTPRNPDDYDRAYNQVNESLKKNGLGYYDIFRAHFGWRGVDAFKNQTGTYRAFVQLQKEGKVKYFGVSQHPYAKVDNNYPEVIERYNEMIDAETESGLIHSMQVWYSYGYPKTAEDAFARASKAGIAMTAMKIYAHGHDKMKTDADKMNELKANGMVGRALIRQVLGTNRPDGKPIFQTCVTNLSNLQTFEENVGGASPKVALRDGYDPYIA